MGDIYSDELVAFMALEFFDAFQHGKASQPCPCRESRMVIHLPDLQGVLQEELTAAIPDSRFVPYAGTGHMVHWEDPERVAAEVVALAERVKTGMGAA